FFWQPPIGISSSIGDSHLLSDLTNSTAADDVFRSSSSSIDKLSRRKRRAPPATSIGSRIKTSGHTQDLQ
ncbi:hypothetical protein LINGRAHAP2_LOCUS11192, partial [Linum grandiflorum]